MTVTAGSPVVGTHKTSTASNGTLEGGASPTCPRTPHRRTQLRLVRSGPRRRPRASPSAKTSVPSSSGLARRRPDAIGRATKDVTLPDSLTTYRIMAVADRGRAVWIGRTRNASVTKPLTLLPAFPRYLSRGDRASFGATVTNGTSTGGDAVITVRSLDAAALGFEAATVKTVRLAAGETQAVRFDGIARSIAPVRVQMTVTLGDQTDAFETTLPVTTPSRLETVAAYGDTTSTATEKLMLPAGLCPGMGGLTVNLASTALVGLGREPAIRR